MFKYFNLKKRIFKSSRRIYNYEVKFFHRVEQLFSKIYFMKGVTAMLASLREILSDTRKKGYAVPAFDVFNLETFKAVVEAAEEEKSPVIIMILDADMEGGYLRYMAPMMKEAAMSSRIPICLHLDHGKDLDTVARFIHLGFNSVMIDASTLPLERNIEETSRVVRFAHAAGVSVEAELGHVGVGLSDSEEDVKNFLTVPEEVRLFVEKTGVDALAVAIGTAHGPYKFRPHLDIPRLKQIAGVTGTPLVIHGGSLTPDDQMRAAIAAGISKVNICTELRMAFYRGIKESLSKFPEHSSPHELLKKSLELVKEVAKNKIYLCGSNNKA
jgi:ketose-bisphosphate aldolase